jgi:hypothetical protein
MFGGLNMGKYQRMTPFVNSNLIVEHCLHANTVVYNTFCDILRNEEVDDDDEVMYHAASIQLMQAYLWKGISAQHVLYLLGGLSVIPARFCANSEICIGTNAHKKVKGLLPLASLNKCLHDLAKEHKVAPMVVKCINCEYYCHEGDANLPFDEELSDIDIKIFQDWKISSIICFAQMYCIMVRGWFRYLHWTMMGAGTNGYSSTVIGISSQMVATLTNGYCSIANHL